MEHGASSIQNGTNEARLPQQKGKAVQHTTGQERTSNCSRESLFTCGERSTVYTFLLQQPAGGGNAGANISNEVAEHASAYKWLLQCIELHGAPAAAVMMHASA